jgi:hypothetical protein
MKFLRSERNGWKCVWLACMAMFFAVTVIIVQYSVRMPLAETFYLVTVYERFLQHGIFDASALMLRIVEHLIIIPILLIYGLSSLLRIVPLSERGILFLNLLGPVFSLYHLRLLPQLRAPPFRIVQHGCASYSCSPVEQCCFLYRSGKHGPQARSRSR